ncbi:GNAT family N-acetyltransferase [Halodurantibacterium flavum]|uniref:L-ornithine N(alpha)-acyltransferase n=1 Tax=Halodurantibacterium flavum TaxID=1382802 RepID=A0ABW4SCN0_9RHOB
MQLALRKGRYSARLAATQQDVAAAQRLRYLCFISNRGLTGSGPGPDRTPDDARDCDAFDDRCHHVLVEEAASGTLVCCFRLLELADGAEIGQSYSAQYYELSALRSYGGRMVEMGRFCIHPAWHDPDILRVAWGALARIVDQERIEMLFGCSSFNGTEAEAYRDAFTVLAQRHLAPKCWLPKVKAPDVFRFARLFRRNKPDARLAMRGMPPLLRSYLVMGGWVSDHAVVDRDLGTLHVFTGLEIRAIPPSRARLMRADAT